MKKKKKKKAINNKYAFVACFAILLVFFVQAKAYAQNTQASLKLDSTYIVIGDQANLKLEIVQNIGEHIVFPLFENDIIDKIEIVERFAPDTTILGQNRIQISQKYTITSFYDSLYYIPPVAFQLNSDSIFSNGISLNVIQPFEIDTINHAITDIKGVYRARVYWWGVFRIVLLVLLVVALAVLCYCLYKKIKKGKGALVVIKAAPKRPAYEIALEELDCLKKEKIWQKQDLQKEYHTTLPNIVRKYIDEMYGIGSMEMPSVEILETLRLEFRDKKEAYKALKQLLTLADLVKFAKWNPMPSENEESLSNAYLFVKETMPHPENTAVSTEENKD